MMNVARRIGRGFGPMALFLVVALSTFGCSSDSGGATEPTLPPPPPPPPPTARLRHQQHRHPDLKERLAVRTELLWWS